MDVLTQPQRVVVVCVRDENQCEGCEAPDVELADCASCAEEHNDALAKGTIVCNVCDAVCDGQQCSKHPLWMVNFCDACVDDSVTGCPCCE